MLIRGLRVQNYSQNMAILCDFDQTEAHFLAPYYQYNRLFTHSVHNFQDKEFVLISCQSLWPCKVFCVEKGPFYYIKRL